MGCFSFVDSWLVKRKEKRRLRRQKRNVKDVKNDKSGEARVTNATKGGVALDIGFNGPPKCSAPPPRPSKTLLVNARERALMADIRRMEALVKKGEAAREAERKREEYAAKRAEADQKYKEHAQGIIDCKLLPDEEVVKKNLAKLAKRCKTARRRKLITDMFKPRSSEAEREAGSTGKTVGLSGCE